MCRNICSCIEWFSFVNTSRMFVSPVRTTARFLPGSPQIAMDKTDEETVGELENRLEAEAKKKKKEKEKAGEDAKEEAPDVSDAALKRPSAKVATKPKTKDAPTPKKTEKKGAAATKKSPKKTAQTPKKTMKKGAATPKKSPKRKAEATPKKSPKKKETEATPKKTPKKKGNPLKRPSAALKDTSKDTEPSLKRPAAAPKTKAKAKNAVIEQVLKMKQGIVSNSTEEKEGEEEGEEEEGKAEDPLVEVEEEKRDRCKPAVLKRFLKQGKIPQGIQDAIANCPSRADQTKLVNRLFEKNKTTGSWELQCDKPTFQAWLRTSDKHIGKEAKQGYPRSIMVHHYFGGNEPAFAAAVQSGEIQEVVKNGKTMYTFEAIETAHVKEKDEKMDVNRGVTNLTASEHKAVHNVLQQFDWSKFGTGSPKQSGGVQQQQLALTNGPVLVKWKDVEQALTDAKAAHERVLKELHRCFTAAGNSKDPEIVQKFKETMTSLQSNNQSISNCLMFKARSNM